jgi:hypothetical protein
MKKILIISTVLYLFTGASAQVPVSKEPMHHLMLDNDHLRILDVHILPGDTSQFHIHQTPSVFLVLSNAKTGSQVIQEENHTATLFSRDGNIWFEGFYRMPRIHRVWNSDTTEFHVMDVELPNNNFVAIDSPLRQQGFTFLFEEKPVRAYRLSIRAGSKISISPRRAAVLAISLQDSLVLVHSEMEGASSKNGTKKYFYKKGDFAYYPSGIPIEMINEGPRNSEFAFFELK